jgi:hypothetical protein
MVAKPNTSVPQNGTEKKLTFAELASMPLGDLASHLKKIVRVDHAIAKAKEVFTSSLQFNAKCVAALKRAYVERLNKREIPPDTTFKKYFEQNAGGSLPGRVESLAALFNALALTLDANGKPMLSEEHFDAAAVDWLEKANAIIKHAMKQHGEAWKGCDDVLDVVNALSKPGDALKKLKEIRNRQKGEKDTPGETGEPVSLTIGDCLKFLKTAIKNASKMPEKDAYGLFCDTIRLGDTWEESGCSENTLNAWMEKFEKAVKAGVSPNIEVITQPAADEPEENAVEEAEAVAA